MLKLIRSLAILAVIASLSCAYPTKPDSFAGKIVTCTLDNTQNTQAGAAVLNCLTAAVGGDYTACLQGLVTAGYWTVNEVACLVRQQASSAAAKINGGNSTATDGSVLTNANEWLRERAKGGMSFAGSAQ